ncbi:MULTISPECIES: hypothetical protein [Halomonadaceae]|uniref:hypothetical protein n=1 Tax=Halomonas TaxID=2745 RepID=UPI0018A75F76|nr:hypothetical protein [Halomonas sp. 328]MBF8222223.1 hypothetical protein [Halomonas sp. 328]
MALFLLVFAVCLLIIGGMVAILLLSRTPRYRTEAEDLLALFDRALEGTVQETEWQTIVNYPIRHDEILEGIRRRAQRLMDEHGRPWQAAQGGKLFNRAGCAELAEIREQLARHLARRQSR